MKKIRDKKAYILLSRRRFVKKQKRKKHRKLLIKQSYRDRIIEKRKKAFRKKVDKNKYENISTPSNFSIINNPGPTLSFFKILRDNMIKYNPVYVDMSSINQMTTDALVYFIGVLQQLKTKLKVLRLKGSYPKDKKIKSLMETSGFLNYFETTEDVQFEPNKNTFEIKSGNSVDRLTVKNICQFVMKKFEIQKSKTSMLYAIISEMMNNTKEHAYNSNENDYDNWIIFLRYYPNKKCIDFIFMDTGLGIPKTVHKKKDEKILKAISKIKSIGYSESKIVKSALEGEFRTKTRHKYRGKGLPKIYKCVKIGYLLKFNLFSNKACIVENREEDLSQEMNGTLYFWQLTKESVNAKDIN